MYQARQIELSAGRLNSEASRALLLTFDPWKWFDVGVDFTIGRAIGMQATPSPRLPNPVFLGFVPLRVTMPALPSFLTSDEPASQNVRAKPEIHGDLTFYWYCARFYTRMVHRLRKTSWAPLPETGPAILIANHTCCIDHLLLQSSARRVLGFMIAREMYELPIVHTFAARTGCIPVNRDGRDVQATRAALRALEEGKVVPIFPEGRITPESGRVLGPIRSGAAYIAVRSGAPVVPAYITGSPPTLDIGPALWSLSRSRVRFGSPLDLSEFDPSQARDKEVLTEVSRRFEQALRELQTQSLQEEAAAKSKRRFRRRDRDAG